MITFGIDTSNYATSLAVVNTADKEVICAKKQLLPVKEGQLGLRQSDAVFHHTAALPEMLQDLKQAGVLENIAAVGVSTRPRPVAGSYMPCFLSGMAVATAVAVALHVPLVKTTHQQGHLAAARFAAGQQGLTTKTVLALHVSGGTTQLLLAEGNTVKETLGGSQDLYAGQAVDRLGVRLGFAFPAGEALSKLAATCTEEVTPKISVSGTDCHLSGLENQCQHLLAAGKDPAFAAKYCLAAVADTLLAMLAAAREKYPGLPVVCAGGVLASTVIRQRMESKAAGLYFVPAALSGDNAVGVALIAGEEASEHTN